MGSVVGYKSILGVALHHSFSLSDDLTGIISVTVIFGKVFIIFVSAINQVSPEGKCKHLFFVVEKENNVDHQHSFTHISKMLHSLARQSFLDQVSSILA